MFRGGGRGIVYVSEMSFYSILSRSKLKNAFSMFKNRIEKCQMFWSMHGGAGVK